MPAPGYSRYPKGVEGTPLKGLYTSWLKMLERCRNPNSDNYRNYGGKGILVCPDWTSFSAFKTWAITHGFAPGLTIERRDGSGNYEPSNCTWATRAEQNQNRSNVPRSADGVAYVEIARQHDIPSSTFRTRVSRGWSLERASTAPVDKRFTVSLDDAGKVTLAERVPA